jgi:two-component system, OmpR family, response regulator
LRNEMARSKIDLVILDLMLGREDGLELARELRNSRPEIGILMLTGRGETSGPRRREQVAKRLILC